MRYLIFSFLFLLAGCGTKPDIPKWYLKTHQSNNTFFYASGEGKTQKDAVKDALSNISGKIYIKIQSNFNAQKSQYKTQNKTIYTDITSYIINASTKPIEFNNYRILKMKKTDKYYILLSINRIKNAKFMCSLVQIPQIAYNNNLEFIFSIKDYLKTLNKDIENLTIANLVYPICRSKLNQLKKIRKNLINKYNSVKISIKGQDKNLNKVLNQILQNYFQTLEHSDINIFLTNKINKSVIAKHKIVSMNLTLQFKNNKNIRTFNIRCSGQSINNINTAKQFAYLECKKKLENLFEYYFPKSSSINLSSSF